MTDLPDITDRIKTAMEEGSIARKNLALWEALRTIERLRALATGLEPNDSKPRQ
jgi:hypothetical protein